MAVLQVIEILSLFVIFIFGIKVSDYPPQCIAKRCDSRKKKTLRLAAASFHVSADLKIVNGQIGLIKDGLKKK